MAEPSQPAALLLMFERRIRSCTSNREVSFRAVNETAGIMRHSQAILWRVDAFSRPMVVAASGLADIAVDSPYQQWLRQVIRNAVPDPFTAPRAMALAELPNALIAEGEEWSAPQLLLCPLKAKDGSSLGGLAFFRTEPFIDADIALAEWIAESVAFALWAWRRDRLRIRRWIMSRNVVKMVAAVGVVVAAIGLIPVPLTALAPAEITAIKPIPITSPVDGVVREITVKPNEIVKALQVVAVLDDTAIRNRLTVSEKALDIARADLQRAVYKSFSDDVARLELQVLESRVQEKSAEVAYLSEQLGKLKLTTPYGGVAIFADSEEIRGKPVQVGERVMVVADPSLIDVTVYLPSDDAVELEAGAKVVVFLHVDPLSSIEAKITRSSYEAAPGPDGTLSYILRADLLPGHSFPRIGLRGTAKIYAGRVSLAYYLFRKPLAFVRRSIGV
jgi:multidrug resistance efflux pump